MKLALVGPVLAALSAPLLLTSEAVAQNYRELPIGGRTATMGGAATAAGNDSAMPYLNPAGLAGVPGDIFAISASVYGYTRRSIEDYFYPNGTHPALGYELDRESFSTSSIFELPSSVMYFNHLSPAKAHVHHHLGVSLVIPARRQVDIAASVQGHLASLAATSVETSTLHIESTEYYVGPSYALGFGKSVRLGVSLYALYTRSVTSDAMSSAASILGGTTNMNLTTQRSQVSDSVSMVATAGLQLELARHFFGGIGLATPSLPVSGQLRFSSSASSVSRDPTTGGAQAGSQTTTGQLEYQRYEPLRLNVGLAYDDRERFSLSGDVLFYAARLTSEASGVLTSEQTQTGEVARRYNVSEDRSVESEAVFDFSVGAEVVLSRLVSVRAGAFSDLAATPQVGTNIEEAGRLRLDRYGGTLGLGLRVGSFDTTLGIIGTRGEGEYGAPDTMITGDVVAVAATETTGMLLLSGAVTVEEAKKTIKDTLPFEVPVLPDLGQGDGLAPVPRIPTPLPPEQRPPLPRLRTSPPVTPTEPATPPSSPPGDPSAPAPDATVRAPAAPAPVAPANPSPPPPQPNPPGGAP